MHFIDKLLCATQTHSGVLDDVMGDFFDGKSIKRFQERPMVNLTSKPEYVVIGCDPNAGAGSNTALVAMVEQNGQLIVRIH